MKKQDLDALRELYSSVYGGEQLDEQPSVDPIVQQRLATIRSRARETPEERRYRIDRNKQIEKERIRLQNVGADPESKAKIDARVAELNRRQASQSTGSTGSPPPAAKPSGVVLARKNNVTGTLDKSTGKFTEKNWTDAETQRYQARAAQNAARTSASSGGSPSSSSSSSTSSTSAPKPPTPTIGKLGSTSFERRTPTSAELRAAQGARDKGASPEQALQAAQKTNLPTQGPEPTEAQRTAAGENVRAIQQREILNSNKNKPMKEQSQEWTSAKTIRDIADAYASIYEAKKNDGNLANNYPPYDKVTRGDVIAGRLGKDEMGGKKKSTKKEDFELWIDSLLDEGYDLSDYTWDDMYEIYEQQLDEGLGSAIKGLFGKKKPKATEAPEGRTAQLRRKYGITSRTGPESPRGRILSRSQSQIDADIRKYGEGSTPAKESQAARQKQLKGGYSQFGMNDRRGRGRKARERAEGLQREDYAIYEIVASYLLENNFAETINDANVIIENMSEVWLEEILNNN